ncbi:hypothetical protein SAMN04244572_04768 [Azotobacter beijerinckii]|uniref:Uncharacterized protein n=1 Tax=Azotobacter beijerinckii TaxID=170623 RepID=A0A1H9SXJ0_9GAMM|nr:hypothetical protein [Azotobacter beijerinckii]SEJ64604.1 hypothetical protein SAMN04244572_04768 [Azotobacter beijerinckii]SER89149.1 hypothetical protein SAMN04244573_04532 [Azotobacter beijerinckii]
MEDDELTEEQYELLGKALEYYASIARSEDIGNNERIDAADKALKIADFLNRDDPEYRRDRREFRIKNGTELIQEFQKILDEIGDDALIQEARELLKKSLGDKP